MYAAEGNGSAAELSASCSQVRVEYLDGWRGLAIITVLIGHFGSAYWPPLYVLGGLGVDLFFVLSGRLMADILFVSAQPLPTFFFRRFARIFPALLVFASSMGATALFAYALRGKVLMAPWEYVSALTFTINYAQAVGGLSSTLLAHIWSLSVEEHCYIMFAVIALSLGRSIRRAKWVLAAFALAGVLNGIRLYAAGAGGVHEIFWRTDVRLAPAFFSAAMFLWRRDATSLSDKTKRVFRWMPQLCVALTGLLFFLAPFVVMYTASALLLAAAVNTLDLVPARLRRALSAPILTIFGRLSYSIYLWQQPLFRLNGRVPGVVLVGAVIVVGLLSYYVVERPARTRLNNLMLGPQSEL